MRILNRPVARPCESLRAGRLSKQLLENLLVNLPQAIREFVYVKHIRGKTLRPNPNGKIRLVQVEIKQNEPDAEQHAEGFKATLVLLCQRRGHRDVGLRREQAICDRL